MKRIVSGIRLRLLLLGLLAVCAMAVGSPARLLGQSALEGAEIRAVDFEGNIVFAESLVRSAIVTQPTECVLPIPLFFVCWFDVGRDRRYLSQRDLAWDADRLVIFYSERGYRYARATARVEPLGRAGGGNANPGSPSAAGDQPPPVRVVFHVEPGEPVHVGRLEIAGLESLNDPGITRQLPLQLGARFERTAYEETRDSLLVRLRDRGYAHAQVENEVFIPSATPYEAQVAFEVSPGPLARFGTIDIVGTDQVSPAVVRQMLTFRTGDLYSSNELLRSQRNLFGLEVFRHAAIVDQVNDPQDTVIAVQVQVSEGDLHRVRLGTGMSTAECVNGEGRWTSRNFRGGARRLEVRGRIYNVLASRFGGFPCFDAGRGDYGKLNGSLGVDFTQPWLFSPANTLGAGLFAERRSLPDVFVRTALGGYVSFTRASRRGSGTLAYRPELTKLDAESLIFCVSFVVCELSEIRVLQTAHWLSPLTFSYGTDRSNSLFSPTRGYITRLETEFASSASGSDFSYMRLTGELSGYRELKRSLVVAGRLRSGIGRAISEPADGEGLGLHPQKRYFAGGPNSVRGFAQYRLGPKVLTADAAGVLTSPVDSGGAGCTVEEVNTGTCNAGGVSADRFDVRPVGGAALIEGNVEFRFPLVDNRLTGAAFVDFGQVWSAGAVVKLPELAWTPGIGVRYFSPIGPIRVDLGYNGGGAEALPVITTELSDDRVNTGRLRSLNDPVLWNPRKDFLDRLQLHISIGQAF